MKTNVNITNDEMIVLSEVNQLETPVWDHIKVNRVAIGFALKNILSHTRLDNAIASLEAKQLVRVKHILIKKDSTADKPKYRTWLYKVA